MNKDTEIDNFKSSYIKSIKNALKTLKIKANDFEIKKTNMRRYGTGYRSEVYVWCDIEYCGTTISGGDPHSGGYSTYCKYSYILTALSTILPTISDYIFGDIKIEEEAFKKEFAEAKKNFLSKVA